DADERDDTPLLGLLAALDRTLHQVPRFIPTQLQQPRAAENVRFQERVDRVPLEGKTVARFRQRPRNSDTASTMLQAKHRRQARVQPSYEAAVIQVPPTPRRSVIVHGQRQPTFRASERGASAVLQPNMDFPSSGERETLPTFQGFLRVSSRAKTSMSRTGCSS